MAGRPDFDLVAGARALGARGAHPHRMVAAALVGTGVGLAAFYVARIVLGRRHVPLEPPVRLGPGSGRDDPTRALPAGEQEGAGG